MQEPIPLGRLLRERRTEKGLSLREFSEALSISHAYLAKLENGYDPRSGRPVQPTIEVLSRLSEGLGLPLEDFLCACGYLEQEPVAALELNTLAAEFIAAVADADEITRNGEPVAKADALSAAVDTLLHSVSTILPG